MPRIRTIKPTHWSDKELPKISLQAHLLWIATWNFSDDEGIFEGDTLLIKSQIFPRRTDIRVEQIQSWLDQLVTARFLIHFEYKTEVYYVSRTFKTHQRIDKAQPSQIPSEVLEKVFEEHSKNGIGTVKPVKERKGEERKGEERKGEESKGEEYPPDGGGDSLELEYKKLEKNLKTVHAFVKEKKPAFIEPYVELWNFFAIKHNMAQVKVVSNQRKQKLHSRIKEKPFDFCEVLQKAKQSEFLLSNKWFGFDWILENESNYLKVIEGSYDKKSDAVPVETPAPELQYLLERFLEGKLDQNQIMPQHFSELSKQSKVSITKEIVQKRMQELLGSNNFRETELYKGYQSGAHTKMIEEDKPNLMRIAVLEYFKKLKTKNHCLPQA